MWKLAGCLVAAALIAPAAPAAAQGSGQSIAEVRAYCAEWDKTDFAEVKDHFLAGYCLGIVQGFRNGVTVGMAATISFFKEKVAYSGPERRTGYERWCIPPDVTDQQVAGAFMSWSSDKQPYWHLPYSIGFHEAFRQEFPCGADGGSETPKVEETPNASQASPIPQPSPAPQK
jgi:Rap1a immunity proteins